MLSSEDKRHQNLELNSRGIRGTVEIKSRL
jgi:hypothetical protein